MAKYQCLACPYVYNEEKGDIEHGIPPETKFVDIPDSWVCPVCGVGKDMFRLIPEKNSK
jgi:rubredoxin